MTTCSMISPRSVGSALRVLGGLCAGAVLLLAAPHEALAQGRLDAVFLHHAVGQHHVDGFGFLRRGGGGGIIGRHQRDTNDAALRRPGAGAAGERLL